MFFLHLLFFGIARDSFGMTVEVYRSTVRSLAYADYPAGVWYMLYGSDKYKQDGYDPHIVDANRQHRFKEYFEACCEVRRPPLEDPMDLFRECGFRGDISNW